ncbi:MAG: hypothetical protein HY079_04175, partial [Elusimicrobia bacterium]|nr:hypothetical protein [Elusimicrobiota bacterium]
MIANLLAVLLCSAAAAAPAPAPAPAAPAVKTSTGAVSAAGALGVSTMTVSSLYTGDRVRDPFQTAAAGGPARARDKNAPPQPLDIHGLQLRGIMQDATSSFALFKADDGGTYVLRGGELFDDANKRVPGIRGRIQIKQKRAELFTEDKDVQVFTLGETGDEDKDKAKP